MPLPSPTAGTNKAEEEAAGVPPVPECSWGKHEQKHGLQTATDPGPPAASSNAGANRQTPEGSAGTRSTPAAQGDASRAPAGFARGQVE